MAKIKKQLTPGRPKTSLGKANGPSKPVAPKTPKAPKVSVGELPKEIVGSHMGVMLPKVDTPKPLNVGKPPTLPPRPRKMPV